MLFDLNYSKNLYIQRLIWHPLLDPWRLAQRSRWSRYETFIRCVNENQICIQIFRNL